ncbi:MAG: lysine--tRNA ligase [Parcubacteria group bacterium]|nr:lysine--tRNA ligase [Parcubacteria group bacterium]
MAMLDQLRRERLRKLDELRTAGLDPYPATTNRTHTLRMAKEGFDTLKATHASLTLAGQIRSIRSHGSIAFMDIDDGTTTFQLLLTLDEPSDLARLLPLLDPGDFVTARGTLTTTQRGEQTLAVTELTPLTKSLRPLPAEHFGLANQEERYRRRYVDLKVNPGVRERFILRARFIDGIRDFLRSEGFLEVETPVLEEIPGGADAEPFITRHAALDIDLSLRISLELHLKRLVVGGFTNVFEIGKVFRNEGMDREHLQEFTMLEFYWAYHEYQELMDFVERMYSTILTETSGGSEFEYAGTRYSVKPPWPRLDYIETLKKYSGVMLTPDTSEAELRTALERRGEPGVDEMVGKGKLIDTLYKRTVRPNLAGPLFLVNHPVEISPLAKRHPGAPSLTERFQVLIAASEVGNGFSELNDPLDQRARFEAQERLRARGDPEAQRLDEDFLEALEYGMPPTAGFGVGIDRLFMFFTNAESIREVILFPTLRPR